MNQIEIGPTLSRTLVSIAVCVGGIFAMWITDGETGIGWMIFGLIIVWGF